jgi:hypothetical protein
MTIDPLGPEMETLEKEDDIARHEQTPIQSLSESSTRVDTFSSCGTQDKITLSSACEANGPQNNAQERSFWSRICNIVPFAGNEESRVAGNAEQSGISAQRRFGLRAQLLDWFHQPKRDLTVRSCMMLWNPKRYKLLTYPTLLVKKFPRGHPNFAAFLDSDDSYMIYRRYGYLQARILLEKQDELRLLEEQLDKLDCSEMCDKPDNLFMRGAQGGDRKGILNRIESTFCEYSNDSCDHR